MDRLFGLDKSTLKDNDLILLTPVNDRVYLSIVEGILTDNDIPYLVKERGCGTVVKVVMGFSIYGADVFVLKNDFDKASALIEEFNAYEADEQEYTEENE